MIFDITHHLRSSLAGWPGDTPFAYSLTWSIRGRDAVNVGRFTTAIHTGTHCDAPYHFDDAGEPVDRLPLDAFVGPAILVDLTRIVSQRNTIRREDLSPSILRSAPRLLLRTGGWLDPTR